MSCLEWGVITPAAIDASMLSTLIRAMPLANLVPGLRKGLTGLRKGLKGALRTGKLSFFENNL